MTPEPTPDGTVKGWLNCPICTCWLVIWTTAGLTFWTTCRIDCWKSLVSGDTGGAEGTDGAAVGGALPDELAVGAGLVVVGVCWPVSPAVEHPAPMSATSSTSMSSRVPTWCIAIRFILFSSFPVRNWLAVDFRR